MAFLLEWPWFSSLRGRTLGHHFFSGHSYCICPSAVSVGQGITKRHSADYLGSLLSLCNGSPTAFCYQWNSLASVVTHLLICWPPGMRKLKEPCDSHNFKFNGILTVSPGGSIPLLGIRTSRSTKSKVEEMGMSNSPVGLWEMMVMRTFLPSSVVPGLINLICWEFHA